MLAILMLGFLVGLRHALEADHVAAVSSIVSGRTSGRDITRHGLTWGLGHTITLFAFSGVAIMLGRAIPGSISNPIETAVGVMLVGLGGHVLWRLWRERVHFHGHDHADGVAHLHAHSHAGDPVPHSSARHEHPHGMRWRTLMVGMVHGMAGSAALLVLAASQIASPLLALGYVIVFGIGSMIGMGLLSVVIAAPLALSARFLTWANSSLQLGIGTVTVAIGLLTIYRTTVA